MIDTRNRDWNEMRLDRLQTRIDAVDRRLTDHIDQARKRSLERWNRVAEAMVWIPLIAVWVVLIVELAARD